MLATNTIAQGDTREVALASLLADGFIIYRGTASRVWPNSANVYISELWIRKQWRGKSVLNERQVDNIGPELIESGNVVGKPFELPETQGKCFTGTVVLGTGFLLSHEEASSLIDESSSNREVLFPYLTGIDVNSRTDQSPSRWIINFFDWPLGREPGYPGPAAADYPSCLEIIRVRVKPERDKLAEKEEPSARRYAQFWWQYGRRCADLYAAIKQLRRVIVVAATSKTLAFTFIDTGPVFANTTYVFPFDQGRYLALLQSAFHEWWARTYSSSMKGDLRYTNGNAFNNFPFPAQLSTSLDPLGDQFNDLRRQVCKSREASLTDIHNWLHDSSERSRDIETLRSVMESIDSGIAADYGWTDIDLRHDFHETKDGVRYTLNEVARRTIADRLLALNHERHEQHEEEVLVGHHKKGKVVSGKRRSGKYKVDEDTDQGGLDLKTEPLV